MSHCNIEVSDEIKADKIENQKVPKLEEKMILNDCSNQIKLKNEILQIYNNDDKNKIEENITFISDNEQTFVDLIKLKKSFSKAKRLILDVLLYDQDKNCLNLEINAFGYINSKRGKKDGVTYFGYSNGEGGSNVDVDFPMNNNHNYDYDDSLNGMHFMIKFNPDDMNYYLKDLGKGFGTFVQIQGRTEIKNNLLLNIGENYLIFSIGDANVEEKEIDENNNKVDDILNIKIVSANTQQKIFKISPSDCPIKIGRKVDNNISIEDNMLSRVHCTINYNNNKWYIQDGNETNSIQKEGIKKSTNGTWIYAFEDFPIVDKMVFKANHSLFICNLIE